MSVVEDIYWDTCLFMEWFGEEKSTPERLANLTGVMREVESGERRIVTSLLTQLEVIPDYLDRKKIGAAKEFLSAFDGRRMIGVEVSANIITLAREVRNYYYVAPKDAVFKGEGKERIKVSDAVKERKMDLGDCIHVATAITYGIPILHTRDGAARRKKKHNFPLIEVQTKDNGLVCGRYSLTIEQPRPITPDLYDQSHEEE